MNETGKATIVSIMNFKGGCGKTTSAAAESQIFGAVGKKVLVVDMDPQCNCSCIFGMYDDNESPFYPRMFTSEVAYEDLKDMIVMTDCEGVDLLPGSKYIINALDKISTYSCCMSYVQKHGNEQVTGTLSEMVEKMMAGILEEENKGLRSTVTEEADDIYYWFANNLNKLRKDYDYIVIDTAPFRSKYTTISILASDKILVPMLDDSFSLDGVKDLVEWIDTVNMAYGTEHDISAVFITKAEKNHVTYKKSMDVFKDALKKYQSTSIRKCEAVNKANFDFVPLIQYKPSCDTVSDYFMLLLSLDLIPNSSIPAWSEYLGRWEEAQRKQPKSKGTSKRKKSEPVTEKMHGREEINYEDMY